MMKTIKKQSNGGSWVNDFPLDTGSVTSIIPNDVFVIIHSDASEPTLVSNADLVGPINNDQNNYGSPFNFNGNDPVGLFKNGVLIDIIGEENKYSSHIMDKTYRRKASILSNNTTYNINEWDVLDANTFIGIGSHDSTLSTEESSLISFKMYPNPTNGNKVYFETNETLNVKVYNIVGKLILEYVVSDSKNQLDITTLSKGVYFVKIDSDKNSEIKKLIKN